MAFENVKGRLYPVVGLLHEGAKVRTEFIWERPALPTEDESSEHGSETKGLGVK